MPAIMVNRAMDHVFKRFYASAQMALWGKNRCHRAFARHDVVFSPILSRQLSQPLPIDAGRGRPKLQTGPGIDRDVGAEARPGRRGMGIAFDLRYRRDSVAPDD